jgi:hypothetical protein
MPSDPTASQKQSDSDQKLPPEFIDLMVAELRLETAFQLEVIQAMMDGVTLGAEQVQDKRLEFLEVGPTIEPEALIFTIAITLILEGTIGPAIASRMIASTLQPIMRSISNAITGMEKRAGFQQLRELRLFRQTAASKSASAALGEGLSSSQRVDLIREAQSLRNAADKLKQNLRGQRGSTKSMMHTFNRITRFIEDNTVAGSKSYVAVNSLPGSSKSLETGNSRGVDVLAAAMADASRFRLTIAATQAAHEAELKKPNIKLSEINAIMDDFIMDGPVELGQIRDSFQLATEAMIWAHLLLNATTLAFVESHRRGEPIPGDRGMMLPVGLPSSVDAKYREYLLTRFGNEVEQWAVTNRAQLPRDMLNINGLKLTRPPAPQTTGWWKDQLTPAEREDLLVQYLASVYEATPEIELNK